MKALAAGRTVATSWGASLYAAIVVHNPGDSRAADSTTKVVASTGRRATTGSPATSSSTELGAATKALQQTIGLGGADKLVVVMTDIPVTPLWASIGEAWQQAIDHLRPRLVLFGADAPSAAELGPRTGARIGARMLLRARPVGAELVELRDRDGGYVRAADSGAAVALVGGAPRVPAGDPNIDCILLVAPTIPDARVELASTAPAELVHETGAIVVIGDEVHGDAGALASAKRLAALLGAPLVGTPAAVRAGAIEPGAVADRNTPLAPSVCVSVGTAVADLAGATSLVRIGTAGGKGVDGALVGPVAPHLAELVAALEEHR